ncbi:MAG: S8 family serine peptidase [Acidobacteria bacterium]|nr:S8 family serine peptidase [Acidobacteriota bacterium]
MNKSRSRNSKSPNPPEKRVRRYRIFAVIVLCAAVIGGLTLFSGSRRAAAQSGQNKANAADRDTKISPEAQLQIQSLIDEKNSRTATQQKIDSQLLYAAKMRSGQTLTAYVPTLEVNVGADENGLVTVDIAGDITPKLLSALKKMGVKVIGSWPAYRTLRAEAALDQLESIAALTQVRFIQPKQESTTSRFDQSRIRPAVEPLFTGLTLNPANPLKNGPNPRSRFQNVIDELSNAGIGGGSNTNYLPNGYNPVGSANAEGVITHGAYSARGIFNTDGTGVKIGVISNGVTSLATSQGLGDLGPVTVLPGQTGSGDEGTAMLEVIHDIAPGAQLFFATGNPTSAQFAQNIRDLRTAGCDIIVDDLFYFAESPFQDGQGPLVVSNTNGGVVTQAVNDVTAAGALYFSSAGNSGNKNDGTSGAWEGDFVSAGTLALVPGGNVLDFDQTAAVATSDLFTVGTGTAPATLDWSDPLGGSANDYDLYILNSTLTSVVASATNVQNGTQDPHEATSVTVAANRRAVILQKTGAADRFLHLNTNRGALSISTDGTTYGHSHAAAAYSVAATPAFMPFAFPTAGPIFFNGPFPNQHSTSDKVETFSSDGPRRIFYNADSSAITPGNVSSTGGVLRQKPDLTAADGEQVTGVGGFSNPFYGTSCAAPTLAAIAGLMKSGNPALTPAQIRTALTSTALDIETAGVDRDAGAGIAMAVPALTAAGLTGGAYLELTGYTTTDTSGVINGVVEQGENGSLTVNLKNTGVMNATGITATLTTSSPNITVTQGSSAYPDLPALSGSGNNSTPFTFNVSSLATTDQIVNFSLAINYTNSLLVAQTINFQVRTNRIPITTTLDATPPPTSTAYPVTASGTQTGRLNLSGSGTQSTCAALKTNPGASATGSRAYDAYTFVNPLGVPVCTTVTLTEGKQENDFLFAVAYLGSYNPAAPATNYLADWGTSNRIVPMTMSFVVPANATVVIVVVGNTAALTGTPYTLDVSGLRVTAVPTAAAVTVAGRVATGAGTGLANSIVSISGPDGLVRTARTNTFGYYSFGGVTAGETYTVGVTAKGHRFTSRVISVSDELTNVDFTPDE